MAHYRLYRLMLALPIAVVLTSCTGRSGSDLSRAHPSWNGLRVISVNGPGTAPADIAKAMNLAVWEFDVIVPDPSLALQCMLHVTRSGRTMPAGGLATGPFRERRRAVKRRVAVALYPEGDSWSSAAKARTAVATEGCSATGEIANPFKGASVAVSAAPVLQPDGTFLLMAGSVLHADFAAGVQAPEIACCVALTAVKPAHLPRPRIRRTVE